VPLGRKKYIGALHYGSLKKCDNGVILFNERGENDPEVGF
jgi:hypothetical protein